MRYNAAFLTFLFAIASMNSYSQDTLFYSKHGYLVDKAVQGGIYEVNASDSGVFNRYFLSNGVLAVKGEKNDQGKIHGTLINYYENGNKKEEANYVDGTKQGRLKKWYVSGEKLGEFSVMTFEERRENKYDQTEKILSLYDKEGNQVVSDGKGDAFVMDSEGSITGRGKVVQGLRNGEWSGSFKIPLSMTYVEYYENGKLKEGKSTDASGSEFEYTKINTYAEYPGGIEKYKKYLSKQLRYPKKAQKRGIEGRVFVQFVVNKDGSLTDFEIVRGIGGGCDEETIRVLKISKKWIPGTMRGQSIRSKMIQNILFKFQ